MSTSKSHAKSDEKCDQHLKLVRWLQSPSTWSATNDCSAVEYVETHISHVFLVGSRVYKLKKPVRYDFLDFSTLQARESACHEEVRLNRRLAPQIYLGVRAVTLDDQKQFHLDGDGCVVDWLVEMQRLPSDRMLDVLHAEELVTETDVDRLVLLLTTFYANQPSVRITQEAYRELSVDHVHGNFTELLSPDHDLDRSMILRTQSFQLQLLQLQRSLFDHRVAAGRIIEGHGDLRPEHICLIDPIAIFDCIEFSQQFRQLDCIDELAFLVSECEFIGAAWIGHRVREQYVAMSGDKVPDILFDYYKTYRASVRAKVAALRAVQLAGDAKSQAMDEARQHLKHADRFCAPHVLPLILIVGGLSGTGKTTLARRVAKELGAELLRSDVVRQTLFDSGLGEQTHVNSSEKYSPAAREAVYTEMNRQAAVLLQQGVSVVLDATYATESSVFNAMSLSTPEHNGRHAVFLAVECSCPASVAKERIASRLRTKQDESEATPELHDQQRRQWQEWPAEITQCRVNTVQSLDDQFEVIRQQLAQLAKSHRSTSDSQSPQCNR